MITPLYALPLVALYILLSVRVVAFRKAHRISLGDGGNAELFSRIRAHANCAEYVPFGLLLLLIAELTHAPAMAVQIAGLSLVAGRFSHAWTLGWGGPFTARVAGMVLTFLSMTVSILSAAIVSL